MKRAALVLTMVVALMGFMAVSQAKADLMLTFSDGINPSVTYTGTKSISVAADPNTGYAFKLGNFFIGNAYVSTVPTVPDVVFADLGSFDATTTSGGTLTITLTDSNLSLPTPPTTATLSNDFTSSSLLGTVSGTSSLTLTPPNSMPLVANLNDKTISETVDFQNPFTLTNVITLKFDRNSHISFDADASAATPEPGSLALVVGGLLLLAFMQRRKLGGLV